MIVSQKRLDQLSVQLIFGFRHLSKKVEMSFANCRKSGKYLNLIIIRTLNITNTLLVIIEENFYLIFLVLIALVICYVAPTYQINAKSARIKSLDGTLNPTETVQHVLSEESLSSKVRFKTLICKMIVIQPPIQVKHNMSNLVLLSINCIIGS